MSRDRPAKPTRRGRTFRAGLPALAIAAGVAAISLLHYVTSTQSVLLHELFKRLYYVPIVVAAVTFGTRGGLAASVFSTVLYLPHVALRWHAWRVGDVEQYGEIVMFNVVALVTGMLTDRLRAERNRYEQAAVDLQHAYEDLAAGNEERLRLDRLATIGRIASGIAHEVRNPLGGILGCIEILESDFPREHPKREFFAIAMKEIRRLDSVVSGFLDFAHPAAPSAEPANLLALVSATVRLAQPVLACRRVRVHLAPGEDASAEIDAEQVQRALLNLVLGGTEAIHDTRVDVRLDAGTPGTARLVIEARGAARDGDGLADLFEPYRVSDDGNGLALATARRLIENQRGTLRAELMGGVLRYIVELPVAAAGRAAHDRRACANIRTSHGGH